MTTDPRRELLRHTVATVAYRAGKALRDAPAGFADFRVGEGTRTPVEILAHMGDLFDWAWYLAQGEHRWHDTPPKPWPAEVERFFGALARFDAFLASSAPLGSTPEKLFQGPIADALVHTGQLALLRRRAGGPVRGENYFKANIDTGRVGDDQPPPVREFD